MSNRRQKFNYSLALVSCSELFLKVHFVFIPSYQESSSFIHNIIFYFMNVYLNKNGLGRTEIWANNLLDGLCPKYFATIIF